MTETPSPALEPAPAAGSAILFDARRGCWFSFTQPLRVLHARSLAEVLPVLRAVEAATAAGYYAAGCVGYEAAPAFDPALQVRAGSDFPLCWFGIYAARRLFEFPPPAPCPRPVWQPGVDARHFAVQVAAIRAAIAAGETYQVNLTFPLFCDTVLAPWPFFCELVRGQRAEHAGYFDLGSHQVCSASPELFFRRDGEQLTCRPMKGTARRAPRPAADRRVARALQGSSKERAENIMILDMLRNDLGRLGPVSVPAICQLEKYPTLWQLTSTVTARSTAGLPEIFSALFPCASITGAPKVRTSALIVALEEQPRGLYTGALGWAGPGGEACFGVAIRTAVFDARGVGRYGVGAGITWESRPAAEYAESLAKGRILTTPHPPFALLESLRWEPHTGCTLLERHLRRMGASARYFDYPWRRSAALAALAALTAALPPQPHKLRLLLAGDGRFTGEASPLDDLVVPPPLRLRLATTPVNSADPFLYHKTTRRAVYEQARREGGDCDEVLLWNERGELTEGCNYNLVLELHGARVTPALRCGLLAGTLRAELLAAGEIRERTVRIDELRDAQAIWLINSVRGWRRGELVGVFP